MRHAQRVLQRCWNIFCTWTNWYFYFFYHFFNTPKLFLPIVNNQHSSPMMTHSFDMGFSNAVSDPMNLQSNLNFAQLGNLPQHHNPTQFSQINASALLNPNQNLNSHFQASTVPTNNFQMPFLDLNNAATTLPQQPQL